MYFMVVICNMKKLYFEYYLFEVFYIILDEFGIVVYFWFYDLIIDKL